MHIAMTKKLTFLMLSAAAMAGATEPRMSFLQND
jgi:hypothetical protein